MLDLLRNLFGEGEEKPRFEGNDYRLAAAALMVHAATIDGALAPAERARLLAVVRQRFNLGEAAADELIETAIAAEQQAIDLYQFTARLNRALDEQGRARVVEMMWEIVFADGAVTEFEDNLIWRAADLLHVSRNERIALRERVAAARNPDMRGTATGG
ncbi:MAG: TerB family tellurite resistance protein [Pseudolabrys sp.]